jgi:hypothetical protein
VCPVSRSSYNFVDCTPLTAKGDVVKGPTRESDGTQPFHLEVYPQAANIWPGDTKMFTAKGFDQKEQEIPLRGVAWSSEGGCIDTHGLHMLSKATERNASRLG